jgi:2-hydroxychromene-2-carboxylate isomerase
MFDEPARAEFLFDFGSPNAYLCHKVVPALEARTGTRVGYVPILLGGLFKLANNRSPVEAFAAIPNKLAYDRLEMQRFVARHGLHAFRLNPHFPVNTLPIMRGAVAAQRLGCFARYVDATFAAMWEQGRKMDEPAEIAAVLAAAGLDAGGLMQAAQEPDVKDRLKANTEAAHARGAFGSPTFFVGDEMFFGKERLRDVEEELLRLRQAGPAALQSSADSSPTPAP